MRFQDKVVLITGGSSGIGAATAVIFANEGAQVVITGRNQENLNKTTEKCKGFSIIADVTKEDDLKKIVDETIKKFGRLDVLVNNAGIIETGGIEETNAEQYTRMFDTNVKSIYVLTHLATPYLIKTKGNIVNVSSVTGLRSSPGVLAYCMSKSAVDQFTKCVALDLAPKSVRVNAVNPGVIVTELHKRGGMNEKQYADFLERCKATHALGRPGSAEEVAKSIAFLASDDASFITGHLLSVDGGRNVMSPR